MLKINSLTLYLHQPEVVAEWYRMLGFAVRKRGMVHHVAVGSSDLRLIHGMKEAWFHVAFHVRAEAFDRVVAQLGGKIPLLTAGVGGGLEREFPRWNAKAVYAEDPAGNIVEWITRPSVAWPTEPKPQPDVTAIAEIGIPLVNWAEDLAEAQRWLPVWDQPANDFVALGDWDGLLIAVPEGRGWVPTGRPAQYFPCAGALEANGRWVYFNSLEGKLRWSSHV